MDTSETYIKMVDCAELLEHSWRWDDLWFDKFNALIKHFNPFEGIGRENRATNRDYYWQQSDNMVWLPRQDQLQEMVNEPSSIMLLEYVFCFVFDSQNCWQKEYTKQFTSMEQLWLAFVMFQLYHKRWVNEEWIA